MLVQRGHGAFLGEFVSRWVLDALSLYAWSADGWGGYRPLVDGGVLDQPAKLYQAFPLIRALRARHQPR